MSSTLVRGRGVHFNEVNEIPLIHAPARHAFAARRGADALLAVQRLGEQARQRGLADPARAGEQEGVMNALVVEAVDERRHHVFLADHLVERFGPPLAGEGLVAHLLFTCWPGMRRCEAGKVADPADPAPALESAAAAASFRT